LLASILCFSVAAFPALAADKMQDGKAKMGKNDKMHKSGSMDKMGKTGKMDKMDKMEKPGAMR
jgi:hypothetical protein